MSTERPPHGFDLQPIVDRAAIVLRQYPSASTGVVLEAPIDDRNCLTRTPDQICVDVVLPLGWRDAGLQHVNVAAMMSALVAKVPKGWEITDRAGWLARAAVTNAPLAHEPMPLELPPGAEAAYTEVAGIGIRGIVAGWAIPGHPAGERQPWYDVHTDTMVTADVVTILRFDVWIRPKQEATMAYERPAQREVDRGTQERGKPNEVNNGPETRKPGAQDGVDKEIPITHGTDAPGQYGKF